MSYGGKRRGAGRPRSGKFTRSIFVTDIEHKQVVRLIADMRAGQASFTLPNEVSTPSLSTKIKTKFSKPPQKRRKST